MPTLICKYPAVFGNPFPAHHPWAVGPAKSARDGKRIHVIVDREGGFCGRGRLACGRSVPTKNCAAHPMRVSLSSSSATCHRCVRALLPDMYQHHRFNGIAASIAEWHSYGATLLTRVANGYVDEIRYPHRGFFVIEGGKYEPSQKRRAR